MGQFVIEFGAATLGPVLQAVLALIVRTDVLELWMSSGGAVTTAVTTAATEEAIAGLAMEFGARRIESVTFRTKTAGVRYALIVRPHFNGQDLGLWMGTVEVTSVDWRAFWDQLLQCEGISFACVSEEEGVDITDRILAEDTFPWQEWPLLVGALRRVEHSQEWFVRERNLVSPV